MSQAKYQSVKKNLIEEVRRLMQIHHEYVPYSFSDTKDYLSGCVFVMDCQASESMSLEKLIADGYPNPEFISNFLEVFITVDDLKGFSDSKEQAKFFKDYIESELLFYRFKDSSKFETIDDVLNAVNEFCFWSPKFIMLNSVWHNICDLSVLEH